MPEGCQKPPRISDPATHVVFPCQVSCGCSYSILNSISNSLSIPSTVSNYPLIFCFYSCALCIVFEKRFRCTITHLLIPRNDATSWRCKRRMKIKQPLSNTGIICNPAPFYLQNSSNIYFIIPIGMAVSVFPISFILIIYS